LPADASGISVAWVTTPSSEVAEKLASKIVENKLAACVNIVPAVKSMYASPRRELNAALFYKPCTVFIPLSL
jgi:periplasmic divalent cation tolerance protein